MKVWMKGQVSRFSVDKSGHPHLCLFGLELSPSERILPKKYWLSRNSSQFHGHHAARSKWYVVLLYSYSALYPYSLCLTTEYISYRHRKALFFSFDLWKWPGHFSQPYLAAGFVLIHTAVVESRSTNQNSRMARAWKQIFCCMFIKFRIRSG